MLDTRQTVPLRRDKIPRVEIYWNAVSYRSLAIYVLLIVASTVAVLYLIRPEWYSKVGQRFYNAVSGAASVAVPDAAQNQARFVNLDGKVEVKKVSSVNLAQEDYR